MTVQFTRWGLMGLLLICTAAHAGPPVRETSQEQYLRKQGWLRLDEIKLPDKLAELPRPDSEPALIGTVEMPVQWSYIPAVNPLTSPNSAGAREPAGAAAGAANRPRLIPIPKILFPDEIYIFSTPMPKFVMAYETSRSGYGDSMMFSPILLRIFDMTTGRQIGKVKVPNGCRPVALSDDGARVVVQWLWKEARLDVYDVRNNRHIVGWQPEPPPPVDPKAPNFQQEEPGLRWARFLDTDHLATFNKKETLSLWSLPDCKRIYQYIDIRGGSSSCFLPDGQSMILSNGAIFHLIDSKMLGQLEDFTFTTGNTAVSPDGTRLAGTQSKEQALTLLIWDLNTGEVMSRCQEQPSNAALPRIWCDEEYLLEGGVLKSVQTGRCLWEYEGKMLGAAAGVCWSQQQERLVGLHLPDPITLKAIGENIGKLVTPLVGPGMTAQLDLAFDGPSKDREQYVKDVREALVARLTQGGLKVQDKGQLTLRVTTENGKEVGYAKGMFAHFSHVSEFTIPRLKCTLAWKNERGEILWQMTNEYSQYEYNGTGEESEDQLKQALLEGRWNSAKQRLSGDTVPMIVYPTTGTEFDRKAVVLGKSAISNFGKVTAQAIDKPQ